MIRAVIIAGSRSDLEYCRKIGGVLKNFGVEHVIRFASAHKVPLKVLNIIKEYEKENVIFVTVAGRSNALSGFVDANTHCPVIACPPYSDKFGSMDILSSLRMPSGVCPMVVLEPEEAGLAAVKIIAMNDGKLKKMVKEFQKSKREEIEKADKEVNL